jgi:uncharacterized protein YndB with AHSA1/START domain
MLKTILIIVAVVIVVGVVGVLAVAATRPDTLKVQRSISIKAAPEKIFALINDFRAWPQWSPYETKDPNMQRTLSGADSGKGAVYEWNGDRNVGQGRMEIIDTAAPGKIAIKLDFIKPIEGHNIATFTMVANGDATEVTWTMEGPSPFIGKLMGVVINLDKMIGNDFESGLANLKRLTEQS